MGLLDIFKAGNKKSGNKVLSAEELSRLGNSALRDEISSAMMKEAGRLEVRQCLEKFSGCKRVFYVVSLYEAEVCTGGLCRYLVGPGHSSAAYIYDALTEIHASRHAALLKKFADSNGIDLKDLGDLEIANSWEFEERKKRYPFDRFDEQFEKLYEKESLENRLMSYVRNHINEFV